MSIIPTGRGASAFAVACAVSLAGLSVAQRTSAANNKITLSGCLVRGDGDGAGYLLTNTPQEPRLDAPDAKVAPSALGTSGNYTTVFYWLDGNGDLKRHIGNRVEIQGELKGNVKDGEIKVDRKVGWTEITVKADGRTMKANVPHTSIVAAPDEKDSKKTGVLVRRVDVDRVTMLSASCDR